MTSHSVLFELGADFEGALLKVSTRALRLAFGALTEKAIPHLTKLHLDLDDVLLEYEATLSQPPAPGEIALRIGLSSLSDRESWVRAWQAARIAGGLRGCRPADTHFRALHLVVLREKCNPLPDFRVSDRIE